MLIRVKVANIGDPDVEIMWWHVTPYIQYEHIRLDDNFRQYFEASLISLNVSRTGIQGTPHQKSYELHTGTQNYNV